MTSANGTTGPNGSTVPFKELSSAEVKDLIGRPRATVFDVGDRLFPAYNVAGKPGVTVFDYATADARKLRQMLRSEGQARKVEQVLTLPIRSAAWEIRAAPGGDAEAAWVKEQFTDRLDWVIDQLTTAIVFRKAYFELTFRLDGNGVALDSIECRPPGGCEQGHDPTTGGPAGFRQRIAWPAGLLTGPGGALIGVPRADLSRAETTPGYVDVPESRSFVFVHGAYREPIEGLSDLDVCYWAWETIKKIQFLWFQFLEQQSLPKLIAYGDDQSQADRNADAIAAAKASGVLGVPRSNDPAAKAFEVIASDGAGAGQFLTAISYLESKMSASVLAGFTDLAALASHSRSQGSYALSADQSEFFLAARQAVADEMAEAVSRGLFAKLCHLQFGMDCKPPTLNIGPLSKHDKERAVNMLNALIVAPQFNVPTQLVDLLINSVAGFVGLPVDQVAEMVKENPTQARCWPRPRRAPSLRASRTAPSARTDCRSRRALCPMWPHRTRLVRPRQRPPPHRLLRRRRSRTTATRSGWSAKWPGSPTPSTSTRPAPMLGKTRAPSSKT